MSLESKKKLAVVCTSLPYIEELKQFECLQDEYDIAVITNEFQAEILSASDLFANIDCYVLPDYEDNASFLPGLEKVLADIDVVVLIGRMSLYCYQVVKAKWKYRFRMIVLLDNSVPQLSIEDEKIKAVCSEVTNAADRFVTHSDSVVETLRLEGVSKSKILKTVPYVEACIQKENKYNNLTALNFPENSFVITCYGNVSWDSCYDELLYATKSIVDSKSSLGDRLRIVICGTGPYANHLKRKSVSCKIDHLIRFIKPSSAGVQKIVSISDCMYFSYKSSETNYNANHFPLLLAMANSIPVLGSRSPVIEETVSKHRIDYCMGSYKALVKAIEKISTAKTLVHNIVQKNKSKINQSVKSSSRLSIKKAFHLNIENLSNEFKGYKYNIDEVERLVSEKQYLAAVDLIELMFKEEGLPNYCQANLLRLTGDCFTRLGDLEGGKNSYIKSIELDAYAYKPHIGLGTVSLSKEKYDIAVIHFQKSVSLSPNDVMANLGLGLAFHGLDELKEANKWVLKALDFEPDNTAALYSLIKIAYERESYNDARVKLNKYLEIHPFDMDIIYSLAGVEFQLGAYSKVIELMDKILSEDDKDKRARLLKKKALRNLEKDMESTLA